MADPVRLRELPELLWREVDLIDGWLRHDEAELLYGVAETPWCEVGCWHGRSTRLLAEIGPGWAVDWFRGSSEHAAGTDTYEQFMENVGWHPNVKTLRGRFELLYRKIGPIKFLHLDAEHSFESTKRAFELYSPWLEVGGMLAVHDAHGEHWPGVERFVAWLEHKGWREVAQEWRLGVFARP